MDLDSTQTATQPATQPYYDPRRAGESATQNAEEEADVLVYLHPSSEIARAVSKDIAAETPQHIVFDEAQQAKRQAEEDDMLLETILGDDAENQAQPENKEEDEVPYYDIALRLSSKVHDPTLGFVFGRDLAPDKSDICIAPSSRKAVRVSGMHFRIYVTDDGILMIEDMSTNGTFIDGHLLKCKEPQFGVPQRRTLEHGAVLEVIIHAERHKKQQRVSFIVQFPNRRGDRAVTLYREKLGGYIRARKEVEMKHVKELKGAKETRQGRPNATPQQIIGNGDGLLGVGSARFNFGMRWNGGDKYAVIDQAGKGAFATVYKLTTRSEGNIYAAKEIEKRRFLKNGAADIKINNELEIVRRVSHPHIVQFHEHHEEKDYLYIIMEFVGYGDLLGYLNRDGMMAEEDAKSVTKQLCHALDYIHNMNIAHRDIKPENILVACPKPLVVKLSDFGLSKMIENQTFMQTFCGTLLYCAPEVYPDYNILKTEIENPGAKVPKKRQVSPYSTKVDIWSLGAVMFHLISDSPPYEGRPDNRGAHMVRNIMEQELVIKPLLAANVSLEGIELFEATLQKDPDERPSAGELLDYEWLADAPDVLELPERPTRKKAAIGRKTVRNGTVKADTNNLVILTTPEGRAVVSNTTAKGGVNGTAKPQARPKLFGEVTVSEIEDSQIQGAQQRPTFPEAADSPLNTDPSMIQSTVSQIQELNMDGLEEGELEYETAAAGVSRKRSHYELNPESDDEDDLPPPSATKKRFSPLSAHRGGSCEADFLAARDDDNSLHPGNGVSVKDHASSSTATAVGGAGPRASSEPIAPPPRAAGRLVPVRGSIEAHPLLITDRVMVWGRDPTNSHVFNRNLEARVPKRGIDIVFWRTGIEADIDAGRDWRRMADVEALVKTRSSRGILVNGVKLVDGERKVNGGGAGGGEKQGQFLCGSLRTGDVIEVFDDGKEFLRYECEFFVGKSRMRRRATEPFEVRENRELFETANKIVMERSVVA